MLSSCSSPFSDVPMMKSSSFPQTFRKFHNSSPLSQARSLFPSPVTPTNYPISMQNQQPIFRSQTPSVFSLSPPQADVITRCRSSPPQTFSPSPVFSSYVPSPMSRGSVDLMSQIDYIGSPNMSENGGVTRRNLGVRTKAIAPSKSKDGSMRKLKIMKEENASCMQCNAEIATLILHGPEEAVNSLYRVEMICADCEIANNGPQAGEQLSKDSQGPRANVECDCCKRSVAVGGARVATIDNRWMEPSFGTEVVCVWCRDKYGFCTEVSNHFNSIVWWWQQIQNWKMATSAAL